MPNTLFLRLEGPLQAWGERARWSVRDTSAEPTKSGVVGLLACALGWNEDDSLRALDQQLRIGVRCDRPGARLVDYHTVVGGVMSAEGKIKKNATTHENETVVSLRHYLADASFLVAVQGPPDLIARLANATQNPVWPFYLGRKSCPPAWPPFAGTGDYGDLESALQDDHRAMDRPLETGARVRGVIECPPAQGILRRDTITSRSHRTFGPRYTEDKTITVLSKEKES